MTNTSFMTVAAIGSMLAIAAPLAAKAQSAAPTAKTVDRMEKMTDAQYGT
jgi:hypothetical protein